MTDPFAWLAEIARRENPALGQVPNYETREDIIHRPSGLSDLQLPPPEGTPRRRGGGLRRVLGTIGDAFLIQGGAEPMYANRRRRERESEAMAGFTTDPMGAAERLSAIGESDEARDFYTNYLQEQRLRENAIAERQNTVRNKALSLMRGVASNGDRGARQWPAMRQYIQRYLAENNVELPFDIPEQYDPDILNTLSSFAIPVDRQADDERLTRATEELISYRDRDLKLRNEDRDIAEEGRNSRFTEGQRGQDRRQEQRLTTPRPERAPRSPNALYTEIKRRHMNGEPISVQESVFMRGYEARQAARARGRQPGRRNQQTPAPQGEGVYRIVNGRRVRVQ